MAESSRPRLLVLGAEGQVGAELISTLAPLGEVVGLGRAEADLSRLAGIRKLVRAVSPGVIVNAAAYTAVDAAEREEPLARLVNGDAPGVLAAEARRAGAVLVHYSTDYVFDGSARMPYTEAAPSEPLGTYGRTKLLGERAVLDSGAAAYVFRTSWVYGLRGRNFLSTVRQLSQSPEALRIVEDQEGSPTWSRALAEATAQALAVVLEARRAKLPGPATGVYHMCAPDHTSWYGFAKAIVTALPPRVDGTRVEVRAITTAEYPTPARRPAWSVLDPSKLREAFGLSLPPWREQLLRCLAHS